MASTGKSRYVKVYNESSYAGPQLYNATRNPISTDNAAAGYGLYSRWINTSTGAEFVNTSGVGAANWIQTAGSPAPINKVFVNVKDFGATGDYTTDDTRAIQAAINAASIDIPDFNPALAGVCNWSTDTNLNGRVVYFPNGRYRITAPLKVSGGMYLLGEGEPSCVLDGVFSPRAVTISRTSTTATVTTTGKHGYQQGDVVTIAGATPSGYNGDITITSIISDTQFTYTVSNVLTTPATGSPTVQPLNASDRGVIEGITNSYGTWGLTDIRNFFIRNDVGCGIRLDQSKTNINTAENVLNYNGSTWTDFSTSNKFVFGTQNTLTTLATTSDELYIGHSTKFETPYFIIKDVLKKQNVTYPTGLRQTLRYQYWNSDINNWSDLSLSADLSFQFSTGFRSQLYYTAPSNWGTTTVNGISGKYWLKITITSGQNSYQPLVLYNVMANYRGISGRFANLVFKTYNWGIFFPDGYNQASSYTHIASVSMNAGLLYIEGNANYLKEVDVEGGRINGATYHPPFGVITVHGGGNSIVDCIVEGGYYNDNGYAPVAYYLRGEQLVFTNNWVEGSFTPFDGAYIVLEQCPSANVTSVYSAMKIIDSPNVQMATGALGFGNTFRDHQLIGSSSLNINNAFGYFESGVYDDPKINVDHYYSTLADRVVNNSNNPTSGNLVFNGDFQRGQGGWLVNPQSPIQTVTSVVTKNDTTGKALKVVATNGDINGRRIYIDTIVNVPSIHAGSQGFAGFKLEIWGNAAYVPNMGSGAARCLNVKSVVPFTSVSAGQNLLEWIVSMGLDYSQYMFTANGETYVDRVNAFYPAFAGFTSASDYLYFSKSDNSDITSLTLDIDKAGVAITPIVEYYNGSWTAVSGLSDGTSGLTTSGTMTFTAASPTNVTINGISSRWIRIRLGTYVSSPLINFAKHGSTLIGRIYTYNQSTTTFIPRTNRTASTTVSDGITVLQSTSDYLYIGSDYPVNEHYIRVVSAGSGITLVAEYWDGSSWVSGVLTDGTSGLSTTGTISYTVPTTRYRNIVNKVYAYWTRLRVSAISSSAKIAYVQLPMKATIFLSDVYFTLGNKHNNAQDQGSAIRFNNGNVIIYANDVMKYNGGFASYVTTSQAPNVGTWQAGDQVLFNNPAAASYLGWVCVTGGVDGASVWKRFGAIEA